jgi:arginase
MQSLAVEFSVDDLRSYAPSPTCLGPFGHRPTIRILGVPTSLGAGTRGTELGPAAVRIAGLARALGGPYSDAGDLPVPDQDTLEPGLMVARYAGAVSMVCRALYSAVDEAIANRQIPLVLGGDHALAAGSIAAVADAVAASGGTLGVVWIDAHGDANTPTTSPTGNLHGMPLASLLGAPGTPFAHLRRLPARLRPTDVALIGARDLDPGERAFFGRVGLSPVAVQAGRFDPDEVLRRLSHCTHLYVSLDVDGLDPEVAPGVGTPVGDGLDPEAVRRLFEALHRDGRMCGAEVVEINPLLDDRNKTARLAVSLLGSLLQGATACASAS